MFIRIFGTPETKAKRQHYEQYRVLDESAAGVLVQIGEDHYGMLPWSYIAKHGYKIIH